jgi:hypothetical protein
MSLSKKLTSKEALRQVFIKVYRLEIQSPPLPCVIMYPVYTFTEFKGGVRGSGPQTDKHQAQSPLTGKYF